MTFSSPTCGGCGGQQLDPGALYCAYCIHERALWRLQERLSDFSTNEDKNAN